MSELFQDNNEFEDKKENRETEIPSDKNDNSSMSLDDRKEQLENKIKKEMSVGDKPSLQKDSTAAEEKNNVQTEFRSPYDKAVQPKLNHNSPTVGMPLPKRNDNTRNSGSSYDVFNNYNSNYNKSNYYNRPTNPNGGFNALNAAAVNNSTVGSPYSSQTPREKMSGALKSYLIIISSITVIFILGFIYECVSTYNSNGIFGGENGIFSGGFDKYLDTDYDFGFKFDKKDSDKDKDSESKKNKDTDSDKVFDYVDKNSSDSDVVVRKAAPDESTVVNKAAAVIAAADQPEDIDSADYTARKAFKRVENSVVNVVVYDSDVGDEDDVSATGSGIIVSEDGYIVTNSHVIGDSKKSGVEIITTSGNSYIAAIVGYDSRTDIAVLKIDDTGLTAAEFVNSDQIEVGQDAIAVGNPGGVAYSNSLTRGCVSALNRTVSANRLVPYIQTDAAINPGNSGGPLLNSAGQVMGITTIKIANTDYEGMGFAIPSNTVISIANDLIGQGYVANRVRIGIMGMTNSQDFYSNTPAGITIKEIDADSPFIGTDTRIGDIITAINGHSVENFSDLYSELGNYNPGDVVRITLYRPSVGSGETVDVEIELLADNGETQQQ